ncbi:hypothetical protein Pint_20776 [Pistacia integerrima]|uniref:Uncharacterized protein n=1 Tax=Pistacia integerrima TaxID=434235 RepID=A0ACC0XD35_9ROSI|nr:hypothetical protein Pint_20776 [Pistacia integerrima]
MSNHTTLILKKVLDVYKGFEGLKVLVDVGGGIGVTLDVVTSNYPHIKGINFDLPHVLADAPTYLVVNANARIILMFVFCKLMHQKPYVNGQRINVMTKLKDLCCGAGVKHVGRDINGTYHASADEEKVMARKQKAENKTHDNGNGKTNGKAGESDVTDVEFEELCKAIEANLSIEQMVEALEANDQDSSAEIPLLSLNEEGRSKIIMLKRGRQKLHQFKPTQKKVAKGVSATSSGSASEAEAFESDPMCC